MEINELREELIQARAVLARVRDQIADAILDLRWGTPAKVQAHLTSALRHINAPDADQPLNPYLPDFSRCQLCLSYTRRPAAPAGPCNYCGNALPAAPPASQQDREAA